MNYNLTTEDWLPVRHPDGTVTQESLEHVLLNAQEYERLAHSSPAVLPALHRFLLAVLYRSLEGPTSTDESVDLFEEGKFPAERITNYLETWRHRFDLFHPEQPFYQVPDSEDKVSGLARLAAELASGSNKLLFDHTSDIQLPDLEYAEVARLLIARQMTAIPEGAGYSPSPAGGVAFVLPQGRNLFETLVLNLVPYQEEDTVKKDIPIWEQPVPKSKKVKDAKAQRARGIAQRYTWLTRIVKLQEPESGEPVRELHYAAGIKFEGGSSTDPMLAYRKDDKRGLLPLSFNRNKAFWRDFQALLPVESNNHFLAPQTVRHARNVYADLDIPQPFGILVSGLSNDKAKVEFWRSEQFLVPQVLLSSKDAYNELDELLEQASESGGRLGRATWFLAQNLLTTGERTPDKNDVRNLMSSFPSAMHYWSRLETHFPELLARFTQQEREERVAWWLNCIITVSQEAWDLAVKSTGGSERAWRAEAESRGILFKHIKELRDKIESSAVAA